MAATELLLFFKLVVGVFPYAIFTIIVLRYILGKGKENTVRWVKNTILGFNGLTLAFFIIPLVGEIIEGSGRAYGRYYFAFWLIIILQYVVPWLAIFKSLGKMLWILWLMAICMNFSRLMEKFVIISTSIHQDYSSPFGGAKIGWLNFFDKSLLILGALIGSLLYFFLDYSKKTNENDELLDN